MNSAFEWIQQLVAWLGQFIPRWLILVPSEGGCKYVYGRKIIVMRPGVHFYWPLVTRIETYPTARQADDLRSQTVVTADDKIIVIGGMIVYRVYDVLKLLPTTFQPSQTIQDIALTAVHSVACELTWEELKVAQRKGTLDTRLKNAAKKVLDDYGVEVLKMQLTDLAPTKVFKILASTSTD